MQFGRFYYRERCHKLIRGMIMRACARVAFVSLVVSVGFGLAGCGTFDRFSDTMTGWFESKKSPAESNPVSPEGVPSVTNSVSGATNEPTVRDGASGTKTADTQATTAADGRGSDEAAHICRAGAAANRRAAIGACSGHAVATSLADGATTRDFLALSAQRNCMAGSKTTSRENHWHHATRCLRGFGRASCGAPDLGPMISRRRLDGGFCQGTRRTMRCLITAWLQVRVLPGCCRW